MTLFLSNQQPLTLSKQIGAGGEGTVYALPNNPDAVAKIYHQAPTVRKQAKLTAMALGCDAELEKIALWPKELVYDAHQQVLGFLMPRLPASSLAIHHLYNPSQRKKDFPQADYAFLVHAARNVAAAFEVLHRHGHCIGDVNQGNVVIAPDATVKLIDCDSFQIQTEQSVFVCEVGVAHFTPPELHGQPFDQVTKTPAHDNFGLAILIFHLLMMGRHPFAGVYFGEGEMTIEKAITEFRYAYSQHSHQTQIKPPPKAPSIDWLPEPIKQLFEEAFDADVAKRPHAAAWVLALESFQQQLMTCVAKPVHKFYEAVGQCPWCEFANKYRVEFFAQNTAHHLPNHAPEPVPQIAIKEIKKQLYDLPSLDLISELPSYDSKNLDAVPIPSSNIAWSLWGVYVWVFLFGMLILSNTTPILSNKMPTFFVFFLVALAGLWLGGFLWSVIQNILIDIKSITGVEWLLDLWMTSTPYNTAKQKYWQQKAQLEQFKTTWQHHITTAQHLVESKKIALSLCYEYSELIRKDDRSQTALNRLKELANVLPQMPQQINQDVARYKEYHEQLLAQWQTLNSELHKIGLSCSVDSQTWLPYESVEYTKKDVMWVVLGIPTVLLLWMMYFGADKPSVTQSKIEQKQQANKEAVIADVNNSQLRQQEFHKIIEQQKHLALQQERQLALQKQKQQMLEGVSRNVQTVTVKVQNYILPEREKYLANYPTSEWIGVDLQGKIQSANIRHTAAIIVQPSKKLMWINKVDDPSGTYQLDIEPSVNSPSEYIEVQKAVSQMIWHVNNEWRPVGFDDWRLPTTSELASLAMSVSYNQIFDKQGVYAAGVKDKLDGSYFDFRTNHKGGDYLLTKKIRLVRDMRHD